MDEALVTLAKVQSRFDADAQPGTFAPFTFLGAIRFSALVPSRR